MLRRMFYQKSIRLALLALSVTVGQIEGQTTALPVYGGDNSFYREFDLIWWQFPYGCHSEFDQGDVYLAAPNFRLYGPNIPSELPLQNVPGVAYNDGSVIIENVRKTDNDTLTVSKYSDHVHYSVTLQACTGDGGAHRYIRITLRGINSTSQSFTPPPVWGLADGSIYRFNPATQSFGQIPGYLTQIAEGADGAVWGLANGSIYRFNPATQSFEQIPGYLNQLAVGGDGAVWGLANGSIYRFNPATQSFYQIPGYLNQLAVGGDGAVWGLANGSIYRFNPATQSFEQNPGYLTQIAEGSGGAVWGLANGSIYRFNPATQSFEQIPGYLTQIAVEADGAVWGLANGSIYRFNPATQSFEQIPGYLTQIAET